MEKKYSRYFWNLDDDALEELSRIFKNPTHPKFKACMTALLSRCQKPKELFSLVDKNIFIKTWPQIRNYWENNLSVSDLIEWWQIIYEQLLQEEDIFSRENSYDASFLLSKLGKNLRSARLKKGFSQKKLASQAGMNQPDISKIEEGKKNITLLTLFELCRVLRIKKIEIIK